MLKEASITEHDIRGSNEYITSITMLLNSCDNAQLERLLLWRLHDSIIAMYFAIASHSQMWGIWFVSKISCTACRASLYITITSAAFCRILSLNKLPPPRGLRSWFLRLTDTDTDTDTHTVAMTLIRILRLVLLLLLKPTLLLLLILILW